MTTPSTSLQQATSTPYYRRRIVYTAKIFGITLRLFGIVLLLVQLVQVGLNVSAGAGISLNIIFGCLFAVLVIWASRRVVIEKTVEKFAAYIRQPSFGRVVYGSAFLLTGLILLVKILVGPTSEEWRHLSSEGSISEYGTAIAYLLVPLFAYPMAKLFRRQNRRLMASLYGLIIVGTFVVGMEEISWGQRLLGFQPPEFVVEFNLHNLSIYNSHLTEAFMTVGFIGSTCWLVLRYWQSRQRLKATQAAQMPPKFDLSYLLPDWPISAFFYPIFFFLLLPRYVAALGSQGNFFHGADQEHWEFIMSLGVLLFVVVNFFRQARAHDVQSTTVS